MTGGISRPGIEPADEALQSGLVITQREIYIGPPTVVIYDSRIGGGLPPCCTE